jgi:uncharacterized membrane protein YqhA
MVGRSIDRSVGRWQFVIVLYLFTYFLSYLRGVSKKFGEWYQKTNKTDDKNKLTLLAFKIIAILHNTLLATFIKLLETVSKGLFRNRSQNRCHTFLDCRYVCNTCAFHDALQAGKQKSTYRTSLIWHPWAPDQGSMVRGLPFCLFSGTIHQTF